MTVAFAFLAGMTLVSALGVDIRRLFMVVFGFGAMLATISLVTAPAAERPKKTSASLSASARVRASVSTACADLN